MGGTVLTGANSIVLFGFESKYGTAAETTLPFGRAVSVTAADINNNLEQLPGDGKRAADAMDIKKFETSLTVEFRLGSYAVLPALIGPAGEAGHYSIDNGPLPITIAVGTQINNTNKVIKHIGCICSEATLAVDTEGALRVSASFLVSKIEEADGVLPATFDAASIYTFAECNWHVDGARMSNVDSVEISINHNTELTWEIGTRFAQGYAYKMYEIKASLVHQYDSNSLRLKTYGDTSPSEAGPERVAVSLVLNSLQGGSDVTFSLSDAMINTYGSPWAANEIVTESVEILALSLDVEVA